MKRCPLAVVLVLVSSLGTAAAEKPPKPAADDPVMVYMELSQVEVDVAKLRELGIDWKALSEHEKAVGNPAWLRKTAELMMENGLAGINANPRLTTIAGRRAVFDVIATRATLLPRLADDKIAVDVTLETYDPPVNEKGEINVATRGKPRTSVSTKTACRPGQTVLLGQDLSTKKNSAGEITAETATLTFLKADIVRPEVEHAKAKKQPIDTELRAGPAVVGTRPLGGVVEIKEAAKPRRR